MERTRSVKLRKKYCQTGEKVFGGRKEGNEGLLKTWYLNS